MFANRIYIGATLIITLAIFLASCGGSSSDTVLGIQQETESHSPAGVTLGGFEVLRYNADGFSDPALNGTIELSLVGDSLVVSVEAAGLNSAVLDIKYDNGIVHPGFVEFSNLLGPEDEVLNASIDKGNGVVGVASVPIGGASVGEFSGELVTIAFIAGATRGVSRVGPPHAGIVGQTKKGAVNLFGAGDPASRTASLSWTTAFHTADGDQNSETNIADITPIALFFGQNTNDNWAAAVADYDENMEVNLSDITQIVLFFNGITDGFTVAFADDDGSGRGDYPGGLVMWDERVDPTGPATPGDFFTAFDNWTIEVNDTTGFSYDALADFDANGDGFINAYVANATIDGGVVDTLGVESVVSIPVSSEPIVNPAQVIIIGYEIEVVGSSVVVGGIMRGDVDVLTPGSLTANGEVAFTLYNVIGTFQGEPFDKDTWPTSGTGDDEKTMTEQNYLDIFAACLDVLDWQFSDGGAAEIRYTSAWSTHTSGIGGDPGLGTVFPDDDPQSDDAFPEGLLTTRLPHNNTPGGPEYPDDAEISVRVLSDLGYDFEFDILVDDRAAILLDFNISEFELVVPNPLLINFNFGDSGPPAGLAAGTSFQLVPVIPQPSGYAYDPVDRDWITLTYSEGELDLGEYIIFGEGEEISQLFANVNGASLEANTEYSPRLFIDRGDPEGGSWSSINKPDPVITVREFDEPQVMVLPELVDGDVDLLQLFVEDPIVRRDGNMWFDPLTEQAVYTDEDAYNDILKNSSAGDAEFPIEYGGAANPLTFPQIVVVLGSNPDSIAGYDDVNKEAAAVISQWQGNKLTVDIAALYRPIADEGDITYAFKLFLKDTTTVAGVGTFTCMEIGFPVQSPLGVDWSVNLWSRGEGSISNIDHDAGGGILDASTVNSLTPDVLWFEFSGGWVYGPPKYNDVYIVVDYVIPENDPAPMPLQLEIAGLSLDNHYLAFHTVVRDDYFSLTNPSGKLKTGSRYTLSLRDELTAGEDHQYSRILQVVGTLPPP